MYTLYLYFTKTTLIICIHYSIYDTIIGTFYPGVYAIEVVGTLPEDALDACENNNAEHRAQIKASKA